MCCASQSSPSNALTLETIETIDASQQATSFTPLFIAFY